ncbi:MAG: hypothetical protein ACRD3S_18840, partial [Terracidiphilus sp.]
HEDMAGEKPEVEQALKHFKASMDAWSDAAMSRPRTLANGVVRRSWRPAAGWALGSLLAAGSLTIGVHEIVHRQEMTKLAALEAARKAAGQRAAAERISAQAQNPAPAEVKPEVGTKDEDLLASVDQDVSRQVPAAMEPLAQLMEDSGAQ